MLQKITPHLWFDDRAEEAARFYVSIFKNSRMGDITYYTESVVKASGTGKNPGSVLTVTFEIEGQEFVALNGGSLFKLSEAISFIVKCETQEELDNLYEKLSDGGEIQPCGWLKDKFGLSWQIVPAALERMIHDSDPAKRERVTAAIMQMTKLDLPTLERAYNQAG